MLGSAKVGPNYLNKYLNNMSIIADKNKRIRKDFENLEVGDTVYTVCETELLWGRITHRALAVKSCVKSFLNELKFFNQNPIFYQKEHDTRSTTPSRVEACTKGTQIWVL